MALGSTPSLTEIATELGLSTTGTSLVQCIATAGKTGVFTKQSDFAGFSAGSSVTVKFTSPILITSGAEVWDYYNRLTISNMASGDVLTLTLSTYMETDYDTDAYLYYRKNSGAWVLISSRGGNGSGTYIDSIPSVSYGMIIDVRHRFEWGGAVGDGETNYQKSTLTGGSFTSGNGTITPVSPTYWESTHFFG